MSKFYQRKKVFVFLFLLLYISNWCNHILLQYKDSYIIEYNEKGKYMYLILFWLVEYINGSNKILERKPFSFFVSSKVVYGLYNNKNYSKFSDFCFIKKNNEKKGSVILSSAYSPTTKLLILDKTDDEIYNYTENKNGKKCEDLEKEALFVYRFSDMPQEYINKNYIFYNKDIDNQLENKLLNFIILHCDTKFKNAFKIEFVNNDNFLRNHFSCEEQGLIEISMLLFVILSVLSLIYFRKRNMLSKENGTLKESVHSGALFFYFSNIFYLIHIYAYALNGAGFSVLKVLSQIYESIFDCIILTILFYLINSIHNKKKRKEDTIKTGFIYSMLKFFYILFEIQNHQTLNAYSSLHSVVAFPFVSHRVVISVLIYNNCRKLLKEKTNIADKTNALLDASIYIAWILSIPFIYFFLWNASVHFTHLFIHFSNLSILICLVYKISEKKYNSLESNHPYIDME
ncbi:serpentine receptor, putative [Plasmodium yoelii]|uniref:Serpentine receptor, putative n=1 Tax=Plasmodium yoelii TaxID=5861 RepID=A0A078K546_PLAYE|nr:serpentine receptor, putative [Plasmodium yoelii]CDU16832.1 serpentine receptor, putative [Plasmodium yoelii]VTZ74490.1 serpentine receptor, putative [Plasmodium yoelii]|eukprot:XP_022811718.1 serpentine receptor, putative [Plasmodium yoelii]